MIEKVSRRWVLGGLIAAPAVVALSNIMPVRGEVFDLWVRYQSWPFGTEPEPISIGVERHLERPTAIGHGSGIGPLSRYRDVIQPAWQDIYPRIYTESILKPQKISLERFVSQRTDIFPTQMEGGRIFYYSEESIARRERCWRGLAPRIVTF